MLVQKYVNPAIMNSYDIAHNDSLCWIYQIRRFENLILCDLNNKAFVALDLKRTKAFLSSLTSNRERLKLFKISYKNA